MEHRYDTCSTAARDKLWEFQEDTSHCREPEKPDPSSKKLHPGRRDEKEPSVVGF